MTRLAVTALGGNAILRGNQTGTIDEQEANALDTCRNVIELIKRGYDVVITHGNGPQVGNLLLRNEAGSNVYKLPKMPLDVCVADTQGEIGYMIERSMRNALTENGIDRRVVTILSQVIVDKNDEAFSEPTKPIGPYYLKEEAELQHKAYGWIFKEDPRKRGFRRVVASPKPVEIVNKDLIKELAGMGNIVIAAGGGGIPISRDENGIYQPVEDAVIDKDLASALLASQIDAESFYILTDVPKVSLNFNRPDQVDLDELSAAQAREYLRTGEFPAGSMGPKIMAAINFVENGGCQTIITEASELHKELCGTRIIR